MYNKYLIKKYKFLSICSNVPSGLDKPLNSIHSIDKSFNLTTKYHLYYQTRDVLRRLNYNDFDKFQSDVFNWVKSRYTKRLDLINKLNSFEQNNYKYDHTSDSSISLVVGGTNSGKTSSYLLALSDVVNDPANEASMVNRDCYRSKMMVYGNLKGYKAFHLPGVKKINGIPKFNWNSYVVPCAIILVPFRELGMNIHNLCSKINIRSSLLAGGKGYKVQAQGSITVNCDNGNVDVVIATPEMFYRSLNGRLDNVKIDIKFIKLIVFEEADLLNEEEYLEKINDIINLIYSNGLNLLYVSRFKTEPMMNNLEQMLSLHINNADSDINGAKSELNVIETQGDNLDDVKKIFIHTSNSDRLELLIDLLHELNVPNSGNKTSDAVINFNLLHRFLKYSLLDRGFKAINLFGGMYYDERTNNLKAFQTGSSILITTNFTARYKLDCKINQVILYDFPKDFNDYVHCISSLSGKGKEVYAFFNNKNMSLVKEIQAHSKSFSKFEFRNLTPKLSRKLHLHQSSILKRLKTRGVKVPKKGSKLMSKKGKMANNKSVLGPRKKKIMKKYYLMTKAVKNLEFLRRRGILKKDQLLPKTPDKHVEASDSQEFIQMKRSPDGFLQIIPRRRSRIRIPQVCLDNSDYD
ncbi:uncharacterized protein TOT_010001359 [Theileria orientalis strain Shintoku]|uniref:RNA helicase n=1 Tax=Theileria orientalis strain Shintoku TaxID=869250 RepID=J4C7U3_THEOR|nr:uncharacterized protein TOT_010001359 [Theileria orientalis strain Shintoku]BAM39638.1 uncharacterized protein TOT_010001359 [Theileria orientalis strain Shintoku]|eukprot:XP_009689939.1 uncharacterized protein TOT_010001359 [Theileria orientalis strain Shintoku]